jgi:hydrogenase maturation protein HypF
VRGTVQGVGFRPFVHRLANEHTLSGLVQNDAEGVWIEVEGASASLAGFEARLREAAPALARVASVEVEELPYLGTRGFRIAVSAQAASIDTIVPQDSAPCPDCLRELTDPLDRRYRYPFINCTACGPRYTLVRELPYDRTRTTMSAFPLCAACRAEYEEPAHRRFHAEPNACPACGPSVRFVGRGDFVLHGDEAMRAAARAVDAGLIVALKGVGGYLLATNARDAHAVSLLRARKRRPHKPFAVMARDVAEIQRLAHVSDVAREALAAPARPIVLLPLRDEVDALPGIAPGLRVIGMMLPSTPLHVLLASDGPPLQVMTSGNVGDEPIAMDDDDARFRLDGIADAFLTHDRRIHTRLDDSVVRIIMGEATPIRRGRGFVPVPIALPFAGPPVLATGADVKNAICITRGGEAFVSQHVGDLASPLAFAFFEETIDKLGRLLDVVPSIVAHDRHPEYRSTGWALASGIARMAVQHHHAHVASCLVEHGRSERAIGIAFDGTGCGPEGDLWGGEILVFDLSGFRRVGHLRPVLLPGGEAAIHEPWRVGFAALVDAGAPLDAFDGVAPRKRDVVRQMIARRVSTPSATGAGRWFDAIAAITDLRREVSYEGQGAIELEAAAASSRPQGAYEVPLEQGTPFVVDLRPTVRAVAKDVREGVATAMIAARFHETLARAILLAARRVRDATRLTLVALSGGCFQNRVLGERAVELLMADGFEVLVHRRVPPNDGGIALGQAAVAACRSWQQRKKG